MNKLKSITSTALLVLSIALSTVCPGGALAADSSHHLRPPAVPLVACDPYFSIWSQGDKLTDVDTTHWTGKSHRLTSTLQIDGVMFRVMGKEPASVPALPQTSLEVLPTRTIYTFEGQGIRMSLTFTTPALPEDIDLLARPLTYVAWELQATDGKSHKVSLGFDANAELTVNDPAQKTTSSTTTQSKWVITKTGSVDQEVLKKRGDDIRIDWGYLYLAKPSGFASDIKVGSKPVSRWLMLAYDDEYSIQYMKKNLRPYWRRNGDDAAALLKKSAAEYKSIVKRCAAFDAELMADLRKAGGEKYAQIAALAYRHCFAAGKFVADENGQPISFCKENHSNGCIGTSDVFYPMAPQFLLFGPSVAKSFLVPFMDYASSERWKFPFAPHDLGTYPQANGQVYGGGERSEENQMPVEETGNLLILMAAVAQMEGNADFAGRYWQQLTRWAEYLQAKGFDPENQLCTDDFAGHLAHNVNLSVKAICGLGSFARLCEMRGDQAKADEYFKIAREFAQRWVKEANDGEKFRLAFDKPGSWSQKYNLVWDRILGLNLFPAEVARKEMNYYLKHQNKYGLPLDNRESYTKLDWITWTATLTQNRADFEALVDPVYTFLNETPDRAPMPDWYQTKSAKKEGFTARPVVGGVFIQMLYDKAVWQKWARRDKTKAANWAPMPKAPKITVLIPAADQQAAKWRYTTTKPENDWSEEKFDASSWPEGWSGFGSDGTPGAVIGTVWNTSNIWLRREVELPAGKLQNQEFWLHHDEDTEIYINGVLALKTSGYVGSYDVFPLTPAGKAALKPGKNIIAVHCQQTQGGQYVDLGLVAVQPK
ncbi:MAG: DUF4965 domain-containing protein [Akkermansiaceae bacterium]|nr:DUF4965 domain-containing protein [Verrucomicrobiales bacterium]